MRKPLPLYGEPEPDDVDEWVPDSELDGLRRWDCRLMSACTREISDRAPRRTEDERVLIGWRCADDCPAREPRTPAESMSDLVALGELAGAIFEEDPSW